MPPFYAHFTISDVPIKQTMEDEISLRETKRGKLREFKRKRKRETQDKKSDVRRVQEQCFQTF